MSNMSLQDRLVAAERHTRTGSFAEAVYWLTQWRDIAYEAARAHEPAPTVVDEAMVERAAEAMWNAAPGGHPMLKKLGHPTDWQSQVTATKLGYRRQTQAALTAALAGQQR